MMKQLKIIFLSLLILSLLVLFFSMLIPAKTKVSRAITISKSIDTVYATIKNLDQWEHWNTALQSAKTSHQPIIIDTVDQSITVNHIKMKLKKVSDSLIQVSMINSKGESLLSDVRFFQHQNQCTVNWVYHFSSKWYPWEKFRSIFYDNMFGPVLDSNLTALKKYIEK